MKQPSRIASPSKTKPLTRGRQYGHTFTSFGTLVKYKFGALDVALRSTLAPFSVLPQKDISVFLCRKNAQL